MYWVVGFTFLWWLIVATVLFRRGNRWWIPVAVIPFAFTGMLFGVAEVDEGFAIILVTGLQLTMAPRLIWEEVLRNRDGGGEDAHRGGN